MRFRSFTRSTLLLSLVLITGATGVLAAAPAGAATHHTYFVSPAGSDAISCSANSSASPFSTIQKAIGCTVDGDLVSLAPSAARPYPGIGPIGDSIVVEAQTGANARTVTIDAGQGELSVSPGAAVRVAGVSLSCIGNDCLGVPTASNEGTLTLSGDAVMGNLAGMSAILNTTPAASSTPASLSVEESTIANNAGKVGGGIQSAPGAGATGALSLSIVNSTIAGNVALQAGGGVSVIDPTAGSSASIVNSTISANTAGAAAGGLYAASPVSLSNTIIAGNAVHSGTTVDCQASSTQISDGPGGHNLIGNPSGCPQLLDAADGDQVGVPRPGLLALANNGGPTDTVALQSGSPALAAGDPATCAAASVADRDQRGDARHTATRGCDIGAFDTGGAGGAIHHTYFVSPAGSDAVACPANSSTSPFSTIQKAIGCTADGDLVSLAPSAARPYPGIGPVADNVVIAAQTGANARSVTIDAGRGELSVVPGTSVRVSGVSLSCLGNDCAGAPTASNEGTLTLTADTLAGNLAGASAIVNTTPAGSATPATLLVTGSTVSNNAGRLGGGIESMPGSGATGALSLRIANSTIAGNFALSVGGGVSVIDTTAGSSASIVNSTITGNSGQSAGGGLYAGSAVSLSNTIIAANTLRSGTSVDCQATGGQVSDGPDGHNLIGSGSGCPQLLDATNGDQVGAATNPRDPRLGPLAFNGGSTEAEPPLPGSPAIGAGAAAGCESIPVLNLDQRGSSRNAPLRGVCDVGAADTGGATPAAIAPTITLAATANATESSPFQIKLSAKGTPTPALSETGALPAGVGLIDNGDGTATIAGTPAAGSAGSYPVTVTAANGIAPLASRAFTLTVAALHITGVSPQTVVAGGASRSVTVTGSGFQPGATLLASNPAVTFSSVRVKSPTTITARASAIPGAIGAYDVTASVVGASASCSACLTAVAPPTVASIAPATLARGASSVAVTVTGSGFGAGAKVSFSGPGAGVHGAIASVSATSLSVKVTVPAGAALGTYTLTLTNRDGGIATCAVCLTVIPGPAITGISPGALAPGQKETVTVTGSGFSADATLVGPKGVTFSGLVVNPAGSTITGMVSVSSTAITGAALPVTVKDGPLGSYGATSFSGLTIA
jgi:hypothetical protein